MVDLVYPTGYNDFVFEIRKTEVFVIWIDGLSDPIGRARILVRIERMRGGNLGDWKSAGGGVGELRIDTGPGYRVYFKKVGSEIIVLLAGGDKKSQTRDIPKAREMAKQLEDMK